MEELVKMSEQYLEYSLILCQKKCTTDERNEIYDSLNKLVEQVDSIVEDATNTAGLRNLAVNLAKQIRGLMLIIHG